MLMPSSSNKIRYHKTSRVSVNKKAVKKSKIEKPVIEMGLIHGRTPDSSYEYNIAQALDKYGWEYYYQLAVFGGTDVRGGQKLDFLVFSRPFATALSVIGGYWHRDGQKEQMKNTQMIQGLRAMGYHVANEVLSAFDEHAATPDDAAAFIYKHFGRS